jgi:putative transcriptional regulator
MKRRIRALVGVCWACLLLFGASTHAQDLKKPMLLVAKPTLQGPYMQTALLAIPLGDKHIGFILNRATDVTLAKVFPEHAPSAKVVDPIYFGGPEAADSIFALVQRDPGAPSLQLFGDLFMTGNGRNIDRIIEQTPNEARYFAGFVGWMPDELASEIERGFWYVTDPDASIVFQKDPARIWPELMRRLGKPTHEPAKGELETRLDWPGAG